MALTVWIVLVAAVVLVAFAAVVWLVRILTTSFEEPRDQEETGGIRNS